MCLEGDFLTEKAYIKVKNENKQLNNAKKWTNYLVYNIEKGNVMHLQYREDCIPFKAAAMQTIPKDI